MGTLCRQRPDDGRAREVMCGSQVGKGKGEVEWGRAFQASGSFEIANHKPPALKAPSTTLPVVASLFDFETLISPGFILAPGREAMLVPIREAYAGGLIGLNSSQLSFLPSPEAFLRLEKAYFLASGRHQLFVRGTLVIFYVSGANGGRKQAIGVARTTFSDTITVEQAKISLARQGVLPEKDLRERAGRSGKLTAFTFDNFLAFPNPVPYSTLKDLNCIGAANLVTAEKLSFQKVEKILSQAFSKPAR